ITIK
ncbi:S4 domain protein, partial [Vibrio harveyi]